MIDGWWYGGGECDVGGVGRGGRNKSSHGSGKRRREVEAEKKGKEKKVKQVRLKIRHCMSRGERWIRDTLEHRNASK